MSSIAPVAAPGTSDLLRASTPGFFGVPLRVLGRARFGFGIAASTSTKSVSRDIRVMAKMRKVKKKQRPWPDNPDPNVRGGVLSYLSTFKPLKEKPKPIILPFEKPLHDVERKINDIKKLAKDAGLDFDEQIAEVEKKYEKALLGYVLGLTPIRRVYIARHPQRPTFLDHVFNMTEKFVELHGDRAGYDDPAIVCGIGTIDGRSYMFIGHQKGRNTKENISRNFGMPTPHGYRKALRMMRYADHHGFPIVTFIDTPGAFADLKCEELGQGEAIAFNLREMFGLKVPVVTIVIGEGGSGGALAIGCGNLMLMLENAVFYVASPEACAAILWKTAKAAPKAAKKLKITAMELCKLQIADGIIPEPIGGAHKDPEYTSLQIKRAINKAMDELLKMSTEELLNHRSQKFRKIGTMDHQITSNPEGFMDMKQNEEPITEKTSVMELEAEVEKLKEKISKHKESTDGTTESSVTEMIEKLKKEIQLELAEAVQAVGLQDTVRDLREQLLKAASKDQPMDPSLIDKAAKVKDTIDQGLPDAPNYPALKYKLDMLAELTGAESISEKNSIMADILQYFGLVDVAKSEATELSERTFVPSFKAEFQSLMEETNRKIADLVDSSDLKDMIERLKLEVTGAGDSPDAAGKSKISALESQIVQRLKTALDSSEIKEKYEKLATEMSETLGSQEDPSPANGSSHNDDNRVGVNLRADEGFP